MHPPTPAAAATAAAVTPLPLQHLPLLSPLETADGCHHPTAATAQPFTDALGTQPKHKNPFLFFYSVFQCCDPLHDLNN